jgi:hypothetical protein
VALQPSFPLMVALLWSFPYYGRAFLSIELSSELRSYQDFIVTNL